MLLEVYENGKLVGVHHNAFVETGRMFAVAAIWGIDADNWEQPDGSGGFYDVMRMPRYAALGTSSVANGYYGPGEAGPITISTSSWHGASEEDWKLGNEVTVARKQVQPALSSDGRTVEVTVSFSGADVGYSGTDVEIREFGLFLSDTGPTTDPRIDENEKKNAMISRVIMYAISTDGTQYLDSPYIFTSASDTKTFKYIFKDV